MKVKRICKIGILSVFIALCAWITVPGPVPFTLQTFAVFLAIMLLGGKDGFFAIAVYVALGIAGLPVFSGFRSGIGVLLGATGGYIVGFLFIGLVYWAAEAFIGKHIAVRIAAMLIGLVICYAFGTAWFMFVFTRTNGAVTLMQALKWCVFPFIPFDLAKMALALLIANRVKKYAKI